MRRVVRRLAIFLITAVAAFADDQQKAEKQMRMMTAMSRDDTARSIISRTFADAFKMARPQMVAERTTVGLNYGSLFLAHELVSSGSSMQQIAAELRTRKTMIEVAKSSGADWKRIAADAKKMNSRISDNIYKHFLHAGPDKQRDLLDRYNPAIDRVRADADVAPEELVKAQTEYIFWRNLAAPKSVGEADSSSAVGHDYTRARDDIAATHGTTTPGSPGR
jgi:hypothetical protein